jgi:chromosome segregation ATPase
LKEAEQAIANQKEKIEQLRSLFSTQAEEKRSGGAREKIVSNSPLHPCTPAPLHENCSPVTEGNGASKNKLILEHERANLKNLEAARQSAQIQLEVAISKLTTAKEQRAYLEYQRQLEQTRRAIALQQQQQAIASQESERERLLAEREYSKAQIETQIQTLDYQIHQLSTVTAPYEGTIKKIKWTGQSNNTLTALVTLDIDSVTSQQSTVISNTESVNSEKP